MQQPPSRHRGAASTQSPSARLLRAVADRSFPALCCAAAVALAMAPQWVRAAEATALGTSLTPLGAEKAANADSTIPAWQAERQDGAGWAWGKFRGEAWKHKGDKPLVSIDAGNVGSQTAKLSPGQLALIKQIKGYRVDVYPTRRSCSAPDFVAENTRKNVGFAKISEDGWSLKDAYVPGIPFPQPATGIEVLWNMKMRYRGMAVDYKGGTTNVSPRKGASDWIVAGYDQTIFWPWAAKGSRKLSEVGKVSAHTYFTYTQPAALAGQAASITDFVDQPGTDGYYYFPGQRRVRRLPSYAYDSPQLGFENQYAMDETLVYSGAPDRFDWKLVGKKELVVPYNSFGAYDFAAKQSDILLRDFVAPDHRRYELHRVWVVEATVKAGMRHNTPKRVFYFDEDSWNIVLAEDYDAQGQLWKVREGLLIPVFETGSCDVAAFDQYNLAEGRYLTDFHAMGTGKDAQWFTEPTGPRMRSGFYTADNLRAISER